MNTREEKDFALRQVAAMDRFLSWAGADPLMGPGLRQRREEFERLAKGLPAAERVAAVETKPEKVELAGQFRGATLDTWRFDFRTDAGASISGRLADDVSEETAAAMNQFTNQECVGKFNRIQVIARGGLPKVRYELLSVSASA